MVEKELYKNGMLTVSQANTCFVHTDLSLFIQTRTAGKSFYLSISSKDHYSFGGLMGTELHGWSYCRRGSKQSLFNYQQGRAEGVGMVVSPTQACVVIAETNGLVRRFMPGRCERGLCQLLEQINFSQFQEVQYQDYDLLSFVRGRLDLAKDSQGFDHRFLVSQYTWFIVRVTADWYSADLIGVEMIETRTIVKLQEDQSSTALMLQDGHAAQIVREGSDFIKHLTAMVKNELLKAQNVKLQYFEPATLNYFNPDIEIGQLDSEAYLFNRVGKRPNRSLRPVGQQNESKFGQTLKMLQGLLIQQSEFGRVNVLKKQRDRLQTDGRTEIRVSSHPVRKELRRVLEQCRSKQKKKICYLSLVHG